MFLFSNVVIGLLFGIVSFFILTFVNVYSFSKGTGITSLILTFNFLYLFFVGPFKFVNTVSKNKNTFINKVKFEKNLTENQKEKFISIFNSKYKIFKLMYKHKLFDYSFLMLNFTRWYIDKPFKIRLKIKQESLEQAYLKEMKSNLVPKYS